MEKISMNECIIEITRRCNMACEHCLRGKAQSIDIDHVTVDKFFSKVNYISILTLTGGEPSLKPEIIEYIIKSAKKHNVDIGSFYIVTNAKKVTPEFLVAVIKLYSYCSDNELSQLRYSSDSYHDEVNRDNINMLKVFSFTSEKKVYAVIGEGRGKRIATSERIVKPERYEIEDDYISEGQVYLNCLGYIISNCDFSYTNQNKKSNIVCSVDDMSIEAFENYNLTLEK